jgi:hypothetical protein
LRRDKLGDGAAKTMHARVTPGLTLQVGHNQVKKFQWSRARLLDLDRFRRTNVDPGTFPHVVILGIQRNGGVALHQVNKLMSILVGPDIQLFAWIEPAKGTNYILSAAEFFIQNFREFS